MKAYTLRLEDIDRNQLPPEDRHKEGEEYEDAVCRMLLENHVGNPTPVMAVVNDGLITISELPSIEDAIAQFQEGNLPAGINLCDLILQHDENDVPALYNSGMALSDLGKIPKALIRLLKAFDIDPTANTAVAIGVAYARQDDDGKAITWLRNAVHRDPDNRFAQRNLAGILLKTGKVQDALAILSPLVEENQTDQSILYTYASALMLNKEYDKADKYFIATINLAPYSPIADAAKQDRSKIAHVNFKGKAGSANIRMDAVMYLVDALKTMSALPQEKQMAIFQEVAIVGMRGLDVNDPTQKYTLRSIPGKNLSGLHMTCYMFVGGKIFMPEQSMGFDLENEYKAALQLSGKK